MYRRKICYTSDYAKGFYNTAMKGAEMKLKKINRGVVRHFEAWVEKKGLSPLGGVERMTLILFVDYLNGLIRVNDEKALLAGAPKPKS